MNNEIFQRLSKCIDSALESKVDDINMAMSLIEDLKMESIHMITLQVELEDEFGIQFDPLEDDFFIIFQSVASVYEIIERKLQ